MNLDGQLVGLTTSLAARVGSDTAGGYAIPMDANVKKMIEVLKRGEEIEYGFLGVTVNTEAPGDGRGVEIRDVAQGQPAHRAGMLGGDTVVAINGNPVRDYDDLFLNISAVLAGSDAEIEVRRGPRRGRSRPGWRSRVQVNGATRPSPRIARSRYSVCALITLALCPSTQTHLREC